MKRRIVVSLAALALAGSGAALAEGEKQSHPQTQTGSQEYQQPATGGAGMRMDMSKMGPWTRKPTDEAKLRKEVQSFLKEEDALMKKRDLNASLARIDFPIHMVTDDSQGVVKDELYERQKYTEMMKPFYEQMPADFQVSHQQQITLLSDALAVVVDNYTLTMEGKKRAGKSVGLLVKRDGQWKWKSMIEPGWGGMEPPATGGGGMQEEEVKEKDIQYRQ